MGGHAGGERGECGEGEEEQEEMVTARRLEDDTQPMLDLTHRSAKVWYQQLELDFDSLALRRMQTILCTRQSTCTRACVHLEAGGDAHQPCTE